MFKEIYNTTSADTLSAVATVIFVAVFLAVVGWAFTRRRRTVDRWARIPLEDEPVDLRLPPGEAGPPAEPSQPPPPDDEAVSGLPFSQREP